MMRIFSYFYLILIFLFLHFSVYTSKKYILLPYNSTLCTNTSNGISKFFEFTINHQLNFETSSNTSNIAKSLQFSNATESSSYLPWLQHENSESDFYFCRLLVKPMGRVLESHYDKGFYRFWNIRSRIDTMMKNFTNCSDSLLLQFRHEDNLITNLESHSVLTENISCKNKSLPIIIPENIRKLYFTYFAHDPTSSTGFVMNITSYIFFTGDFPVSYQQELCRERGGFWCGNGSNVCINEDSKCDGSDSCFDGGSDEIGCPSVAGWMISSPRPIGKSRLPFIDYLPWLALGVLPLVLLMALVCICNQHRTDVFFDNADCVNDNDEINNIVDFQKRSLHLYNNIDSTNDSGNDKQEDDDDGYNGDGKTRNDNVDDYVSSGTTKACVNVTIGMAAMQQPDRWRRKGYEDDGDNDGDDSDGNDEEVLIDNHSPRVPKESLICLKPIHSNQTNDSGNGYKDNNVDRPSTNHEDTDQCAVGSEIETCLTQTLGFPRNLLPSFDLQNGAAASSSLMTLSQYTDEDYELEDVGSLLRKVDKSKIPEEKKTNEKKTVSGNSELPINQLVSDSGSDYRSDYILV